MKSLGQIAYEAYRDAKDLRSWQGLPWGDLSPHEQKVWETVALAVRDPNARKGASNE